MTKAVGALIAICALAGASTPASAPEFRTDKVRYIGGELLTRRIPIQPWANSLIIRPERLLFTLEGGESLDILCTSITAVAYSRALAPDEGVVGLPAFPAPIPIFYLGWVRKQGLHYIAIDYDRPGGAQASLIIQADKKDYVGLLRALNAATGRPIAMSAADRPRFPHDLATTNLSRPLLALPGVPLWSIERLVAHASDVTAVAFSPDGALLASASKDGTILVWDLQTRQVVWQPPKRGRGGNQVAFGPNGLLAAWREWSDDRITIWNVASREFVGEVGGGKQPGARRVVFRNDGRVIAVGLDGVATTGTVPLQLWRLPELESAGQFAIRASGGSIAFDPGGATLTSWGYSGHLSVWDASTLAPIPSPYTDGPSAASAFNKPTALLAVLAVRTVTLWDAKAGVQHGVPMPSYFEGVWGTEFTADGARLSIAAGGTLLLYDVATQSALGQCVVAPLGSRVTMAMSADGTQLAAVIEGDHGISMCVPPRGER